MGKRQREKRNPSLDKHRCGGGEEVKVDMDY